MSAIDELIDDVQDQATDLLNSQGRSGAHVATGIVLTVGFALLATALASNTLKPKRTERHLLDRAAPVMEKPRGAFSLILPAVFSATTLSAVRVWNAPASRERSLAMGLWFAAQTINAVWLGLRPASMRSQIAAAMSSAGLAAAFAFEARKLDEGAGKIAAPIGSGTRIANFIQRKTDHVSGRTLH
ncbi:tryptophan-rich sensory protein [Brevundimonas goettingensis]|jgi:benzodiazapine receptor|uniref:TspO protein n=1 Tax=Brevundimonas goettingensis TaxID=2774190 RepID=A0A975C1R6_9CAUL|nr:tryptophan-rich sensory protein [Brevundimonas goettingensis]QTC89751.1 TspO protein [Brevundimonas goettingensis]